MLRKMHKKDIPELVQIELHTQPSPWSEGIFNRCFEDNYPGFVIEQEKKVIGFILYSIKIGECHILNIGILPEFQRQGFGSHLLSYVINLAKKDGAGIVFLEVRSTNTKAISLYKKMEFVQIGVRRDYYTYPEGSEDALVFAKELRLQ